MRFFWKKYKNLFQGASFLFLQDWVGECPRLLNFSLLQLTTISELVQKKLKVLSKNCVRVGLLAGSYRKASLKNCARSGRGLNESIFARSDETEIQGS